MLHESRISDAPPAWKAEPPAAASETELERLIRGELDECPEWRVVNSEQDSDGIDDTSENLTGGEFGGTMAEAVPRMKGKDEAITPTPDQARYLKALSKFAVERMARQAAGGISRWRVRNWRRHEWFRAAEREAADDAGELLIATAWQAATEGRLEPVYQLGQLVGYKRVFSEKLLIELLRGFRPEVFRPKQTTTTNNNNVVLATPAQISEVVRRLSPTNGTGEPKPLAPIPPSSATV